jgi:hypothetical protein
VRACLAAVHRYHVMKRGAKTIRYAVKSATAKMLIDSVDIESKERPN